MYERKNINKKESTWKTKKKEDLSDGALVFKILSDINDQHVCIPSSSMRITATSKAGEEVELYDSDKSEENGYKVKSLPIDKPSIEKEFDSDVREPVISASDERAKRDALDLLTTESGDAENIETLDKQNEMVIEELIDKLTYNDIYEVILKIRAIREHLNDIRDIEKCDEYKATVDTIYEILDK